MVADSKKNDAGDYRGQTASEGEQEDTCFVT